MTDTDLETINGPDPTPDRDQERAAAFSAPPFFWKETELAPLAISREADWLLHCQRIGLPTLDAVINEGDAFLAHAIRMIWFCAHRPSKWLAHWIGWDSTVAPYKLDLEIREWADEQITPGDDAIAAIKLALAIHDRARINQATLIDEEDADAEGNTSGPAHELNTSASSSGPAPAHSPKSTSPIISPRSAAGPTSTPTAAPTAAPSNGRKKWLGKKRRSARG